MPSTVKESSFKSKVKPCLSHIFLYISRGRLNNFLEPINFALIPRAETTGINNLKLLPDSFTSIVILFIFLFLGITFRQSFSALKSAKIETASFVAVMSIPTSSIQGFNTLSPSAKKDAIKAL